MHFKKGDIVEVTEEDRWCGQKYNIGTQWVVVDITHRFVIVKDDRQHDGEGTIFKFRVKLIEEENKMLKFKEGQTYICTETHATWWTVGKEYPVTSNAYKRLVIKDDNGTLWYDYELNKKQHKFILKDEPLTENPPMEETTMTDLIDNQPHYKNQGIEPIDLMRKNFTKEEFTGFLQGNVLKYMLRYKDKNGLEDLKKAKTYLTWLIDELDDDGVRRSVS
ncbi:hypothetical phage protein [Enterococcus phage vB_EhiS_268]|uniref:Hypothetical phage protein n=1 Tax=Enterococcus phage vB_EhiS_268 TaxID=2736817 RepID=A0ACA9ASV0_9CAUD|nr:hypothetical phage protein [Enterococcus phage vB_EhiS_268]